MSDRATTLFQLQVLCSILEREIDGDAGEHWTTEQ
jgi:hypothetical protein